MKKEKKIVCLLASLVVASAGVALTMSAGASSRLCDFENETCGWTALYQNADYTFNREDNGNTYLNLSYNGNKNRNREYFDVKVKDLEDVQGQVIQIDFDIMGEAEDFEKTAELQIKRRTGPGSADTTLAARVRRVDNNLQIQYEDMYERLECNGRWFAMESGHWYTVKFMLDLSNHTQSIYVFDKETNEILASKENYSAINDIDDVNMVTFSSGGSINLDNVRAFVPVCENLFIMGEPYLSDGEEAKYICFGQDVEGNITKLPSDSEIVWSINENENAASVAADGTVTIEPNPAPYPIILKAEQTAEGNVYEGKYVINVSK